MGEHRFVITELCDHGSSTAPLSRFTRKPPGQEGGLGTCAWAFPGRADKEDHGAGGRPGQSGALPPATRTEPREQRG